MFDELRARRVEDDPRLGPAAFYRIAVARGRIVLRRHLDGGPLLSFRLYLGFEVLTAVVTSDSYIV